MGFDGSRAGIHKKKTTSAVSVLGFALLKASLSHQGGLLVAQDPGNRHSLHGAEEGGCMDLAAGADARQHGFGDAKDLEQFRVPGECLQIHELGAAGVGNIGDVNAAFWTTGQSPHEKTVKVAEERITRLSLLADSGNVFQEPADFQTTEVRGQRQTRLRSEA